MMLRHAAHLGQAHGRAGGCEHKDTLPQQVVRDAVHKFARRHRVEELRLKTGGVNTNSVTGAMRHAACCVLQAMWQDCAAHDRPRCAWPRVLEDTVGRAHFATCHAKSEASLSNECSCQQRGRQALGVMSIGSHLPIADAVEPVDAARHDLVVQSCQAAAGAAAARLH